MEQRGGMQLSSTTGAHENLERGDFVASSGESIECKSQPVDPTRHRQGLLHE